MIRIYFWQQMLTPHMTALAISLSKIGYEIFYVAETSLSKDRQDLGWEVQNTEKINVHFVKNHFSVKSIIQNSPANSIHICQGLRNNGIISYVQKQLKINKSRQWLIIETIRDYGIQRFIRRAIYKIKTYSKRKSIEGILAIGWKTPELLIKSGFSSEKIFPFSYFIGPYKNTKPKEHIKNDKFRFIYVGSLVSNKNLDLLIKALSLLKSYKFELIIIGDGPKKKAWKNYADELIPNCSFWKGAFKMSEVYQFINVADCLVLPSKHDGWGTVVSEALISGVPAICSDTCGVAEVVKLSNYGGVFKSGNIDDLVKNLKVVLDNGQLEKKERQKLLNWSKKITSDEGANYLKKIINFTDGYGERPKSPWNEY